MASDLETDPVDVKQMIKEFKRGETLFSGINHRNYNVRTREISKNISNSLSKDLS